MGLTFGDPSFNNLIIVEAEVAKGGENVEQLRAIQKKLHAYMGVQAKYFEIKTDLRFDYSRKVGKGDKASLLDLKDLVNHRDSYHASFSRYECEEPEYEVYMHTLGEIVNTKIRKMHEDFNEYEKVHNERSRIYHHFMSDQQSEALDTFREELLQHLAGSIVVKEHRTRYQKEQFDRFMFSLSDNRLYKKNQTLKEFCLNYADMIEGLIKDSHNGKSPKIEANYDDFSERTLRPFNATIFYYFFSGDRRSRTMAQWLLSAIRYPNDRVRRAYMRFFA